MLKGKVGWGSLMEKQGQPNVVCVFIHTHQKGKSTWWGWSVRCQRLAENMESKALSELSVLQLIGRCPKARHLLIHNWAGGQPVYTFASGILCFRGSHPKEFPDLWLSHSPQIDGRGKETGSCNEEGTPGTKGKGWRRGEGEISRMKLPHAQGPTKPLWMQTVHTITWTNQQEWKSGWGGRGF